MRKKELANQKVIRAITLGLATFMALQSPMAVLAAEDGVTNDPPAEETQKDEGAVVVEEALTETNNAIEAIGVKSTDTKNDDLEAGASKACDTVAEAILSELVNAGAPVATTGSEGNTTTEADGATGSEGNTAPTADGSTAQNAETSSTATISDEAKQDVITAAQKLADDTVQPIPTDDSLKAADDNIVNAATAVNDIKEQLNTAKEAHVQSNEAAMDVMDDLNIVQNAADDAETAVSVANQEADDLINTIKTTDSPDTANKAYDDLDKLVQATTKKIEDKEKEIDDFSKKLEAAFGRLETAEKNFDDSIGNAQADVTKAKNELDAAHSDVVALQTAISDAQEDIREQNKIAFDIIDKMLAVDKEVDANPKKWDAQRALFTTVLKDYLFPQINPGATDIKVSSNSIKPVNDGLGTYHYYIVTYKDANGVKHTEYYNYDRTDRTTDDQGTDHTIAIYVKDEKEIKAGQHLQEYLAANGIKQIDPKDTDYKVYMYEENGETKYILEKEIQDGITNGTIVQLDDGSRYIKNEATDRKTLISEIAAPTALTDVESGQSTTSRAYDDTEPTTSRFELNANGDLVEIVSGKYVETVYTRVTTTPTTPDKTPYTPEQKDQLIADLEESLSKSGQNVKVEFAEVVESGKTYYQLTGSYVPLFSIKINEGEVEEYAGPVIENPLNTKPVTQKEQEGLTTFISRLKDQGYTVTVNPEHVEWLDDGANYGKEEILIWGTVKYTKDGVNAISVTQSGEYTELSDAEADINSLIESNLSKDGINGNSKGKNQLVFTTWTHWLDIPYETTASFSVTEEKTNVVISGKDGYQKYSYYVDYLQKVVGDAKSGDLTEIEYANATKMILEQIVQAQNSIYNGNDLKLNTATDEDFNKFIQDAKDLLEQYEGYATQAEAAETKVKDAQTAVDDLAKTLGMIESQEVEDINQKHYNNQLTLRDAFDELGIEDWQKFMGLDSIAKTEDMTDEEYEAFKSEMESILDMTVEEAAEQLQARLDNAKQKLSDAKKNLGVLQTKLNNAGTDLSNTIDRLTPPADDEGGTSNPGQPGGPGAGGFGGFGGFTFETPATPGDGGAGGAGGDGGATGGTNAGTVAGTQTANAGAGAGAGAGGNGVLGARTNNTGRGGRVAAGAGVDEGNGGDEVTTIDDGKTALAGSIETAKPQDSDDTTKKADTVTIQDTDPAKASFDDINNTDEDSHTWLWWILALIAGTVTLEEFIRRQRNKAQAAETSASGSAKSDNKPVD